MNTTDVLVECKSCGFTALEHEFGNASEELVCPNCKDGCNLWDVEDE